MAPRGRATRARSAQAISVAIASAVVSLSGSSSRHRHQRDAAGDRAGHRGVLCVLLRLVLTFRAHQTVLRRTTREALDRSAHRPGQPPGLRRALGDRLDDDDPEPLVLALFDLDGFKSYNDNFGHAAGDALLAAAGRGLESVIGRRRASTAWAATSSARCCREATDGDALLRAALASCAITGTGSRSRPRSAASGCPEETATSRRRSGSPISACTPHKSGAAAATAALEVKHALLLALAQRDPELSDHVDDVAELAAGVAASSGVEPAQVETVRIAAELHDIGKIAIPEAILRQARRRSTTTSGRSCASTRSSASGSSPPRPPCAEVGAARALHATSAGTAPATPTGSPATAIPLGARIIAVCDAYRRDDQRPPYRKALEHRGGARRARALRRHAVRPRRGRGVPARWRRGGPLTCAGRPSPSPLGRASRPRAAGA